MRLQVPATLLLKLVLKTFIMDSDILKKKCTKCKDIKSIADFSNNPLGKLGLNPSCKQCVNIYNYNRRRTKIGLIKTIYSQQKRNSKNRGHNPPNYTIDELISWVESRDNWDDLYVKWRDSGYNSDNTPSIDRISNKKGYSFDNIQLMTWSENKAKAYLDVEKCDLIRFNSKAVIQYSLTWDYINEFKTIGSASRSVGASRSGIQKACVDKGKSSGGFKWRYKAKIQNILNSTDVDNPELTIEELYVLGDLTGVTNMCMFRIFNEQKV